MSRRIEQTKDSLRIASFSNDPENFLLWSHYADGHKGIAIEVDLPDTCPELYEVTYSPFNVVFTSKGETREDMTFLFCAKAEDWEYEKEYRILYQNVMYSLPNPITRVFLGHRVPDERERLLREALDPDVEVVRTTLDEPRGKVVAKLESGARAW